MSEKLIEERAKALKARIDDLVERLPYADGQAYYEDKRRIEALRAELANLEKSK